jgi:hypothetical protein
MNSLFKVGNSQAFTEDLTPHCTVYFEKRRHSFENLLDKSTFSVLVPGDILIRFGWAVSIESVTSSVIVYKKIVISVTILNDDGSISMKISENLYEISQNALSSRRSVKLLASRGPKSNLKNLHKVGLYRVKTTPSLVRTLANLLSERTSFYDEKDYLDIYGALLKYNCGTDTYLPSSEIKYWSHFDSGTMAQAVHATYNLGDVSTIGSHFIDSTFLVAECAAATHDASAWPAGWLDRNNVHSDNASTYSAEIADHKTKIINTSHNRYDKHTEIVKDSNGDTKYSKTRKIELL